ncbi:MAG: RNA ligase [Thermodesulfovibrionales bacterium]
MGLPGFLRRFLPEGQITEKRLAPYSWDSRVFVRLTQDAGGHPRGTVFWEGGVIPGYPRVQRTLHLERGIRRYFKGGFHVEEKVDGYNVRVARVEGRDLAFTRGGFICPFTTDRLPDLVGAAFLDGHPGHVLCGEVAGPENPYNTEPISFVAEDVQFFAFDVLAPGAIHVSPERRYTAMEESGVGQARHWGPFTADDMAAIKEIVLRLDAGGREGVVVKAAGAHGPGEKRKAMKYVTLSSCVRDMGASAHLMADIPGGFFVQRILRAVYAAHEFGMALSDPYLLEAARALYRPNERLVAEIEGGGGVAETFSVRVRDRSTVDALLQHIHRAGLRTSLISVERDERGYHRARFQRLFDKGTKAHRRRLRGHGFFD